MSMLVLLAAAVFYGAGLVVALQNGTPPEATAAAQAPPPQDPASRAFVGFSIGVHSVHDITIYTDAIDAVAAMGCDAVQVLTPMYQTHGASTELSRPPERCPTDAQLETILLHAQRRGMTVHLMPIVLLAEPRDNEWRGKLLPDDWDAWWAGYTEQMLRYANIAERTDVAMLSVGSELLSTEKQTDRWRALIEKVRKRYPGRLMYSTNWDHYHVPTFWDRLDRIGINGYWTIVDNADAPDDAIAKRWHQIRGQVLAFADKADRRVVFTEIGYPALPWALKDPWNYIADTEDPADPAAQRRGYEAFLAAWGDLLRTEDAPIAGVYFYEWDVHKTGDAYDKSYGVRGKPAYDVLTDWLKE